ncbi:MAG: Yip1 family protein [Ktedonobacterales bacterium]
MDSHESSMRQGTDGAPSSTSAYPVPPVGVQAPFPAPPDIPDISLNEPVFWRMADILTHPTSIPRYIAHLRGAKWSTIVWLVLGLGILESVATAIQTQIFGSSLGNIPGFGQLSARWQAVFNAVAFLSGLHGNLLTTVVYFILASGLYWLIAKLLGGQGTFLQSTWLFALISTPINAAAALLGLIPVLGLVAYVVLGIAQVVLTIFAMAAAHRLTLGKATVVVLTPLALGLVVIFCTLAVSLPY